MESPGSSTLGAPSFIDGLDEESARPLFHFLSDLPSRPRWSRHIAWKNLLLTMHLGGALCDEAKLVTTRVKTGRITEKLQGQGDGDCNIISKDHLLDVMAFAGDSLKDLQLHWSMVTWPPASVPSWT